MSNKSGSFAQITLRKIRKNPLGIISLALILFAGLITIFAYPLSNDKVIDANQQNVILAHKPIGFKQLTLEIPLENFSDKFSLKNFFLGKLVESDQIPISSYKIEKDSISYVPYLGEGFEGEISKIALKQWKEKGVPISQIEKDFIYTKSYWLGTDSYGRDFYSRLVI